MEHKVFQGLVDTDGSSKIICPPGKVMTVTNIIINNPDGDYSFVMNRYMDGVPGIHLVPIYSFDLKAGDTLRDTEHYRLTAGNYLQMISNIPGGTYYVKAILE